MPIIMIANKLPSGSPNFGGRSDRSTFVATFSLSQSTSLPFKRGQSRRLPPPLLSRIQSLAIWIGLPILIFDFLNHCIDQPATEIDYHREHDPFSCSLPFVPLLPGEYLPFLCYSHSFLCSFNALLVDWKCGKVRPCLLDRYQHSFVMKLLAHLL